MFKTVKSGIIMFWLVMTAGILSLILYLGLQSTRPHSADVVTVLPEKKALSIMGRGLAYVDDMSSFRESGRSGELTIEMAVLADNHSASGFRSLLMLHDGSDKRQLFVGQWKKSIVIMNGDDYDYTRKRPRLSGNDVFSTEFIRLITVTADGQGTRLYVDGSLVDAVKNWQLKMPQRGQRGQLRINDFR